MTKTIEAAAPLEHSSLVGGSTAARRLACPASYSLEQRIPKDARNRGSRAASEGTALHEAMAYMLENDIVDANDVLGMEFGKDDPYVITQEQVDTALQPALHYFDALVERMESEPGAGEVKWLVETRVEVPGIPNAFGTTDVAVYSNVRTAGLDWKFGSGKRVLAVYPDPDEGDLLNAQGMFYLRGLLHTLPEAFGNIKVTDTTRPIEFHIVQPRARVDEDEDPNSMAGDITAKELEDFRMALVRAIAEATGKDPSMRRGPHCDFAVCKDICPKWTGAVLDMTKVYDAMEQRKGSALGDVFDYGDSMAVFLGLADIVEGWIKSVRDGSHSYAESGGDIPGYKLVPKRATRQWRDEAVALDTLREVLPENALMKTTLCSPKQVEDALKAAKKGALPAGPDGEPLFIAVSSGTTLAKDKDKREAVTPPGVVVDKFRQIISALLPPDPRPE